MDIESFGQRKSPYILWFGAFNGAAIEQLPFVIGGWEYLNQVLCDSSLVGKKIPERVVKRAREVVEKAKKLVFVATCGDCGAPAEVFLAKGNSQVGYYYLSTPFCAKCASRMEDDFNRIPMCFSTLVSFGKDFRSKRQFLDEMKIALTLRRGQPITKRLAVKIIHGY